MNKSEKPRNTLGLVLQVSIPLLLIVAGLEIGAFVFGRKSTQLESSGVLATAEVYDVTIDVVGEGLQVLSDDRSNRSTNRRSEIGHWKTHYRFETADGVEVKSSVSGSAYEAPKIGRKFEVRYSELDPIVHETAIGHTSSQTEALHWIAAFFAATWLVTIACILGSAWKSPRLTTREKRLKRMEELASKKD